MATAGGRHVLIVEDDPTTALVLSEFLASYGYHKGSWKKRRERRFNALLNDEKAKIPAALR